MQQPFGPHIKPSVDVFCSCGTCVERKASVAKLYSALSQSSTNTESVVEETDAGTCVEEDCKALKLARDKLERASNELTRRASRANTSKLNHDILVKEAEDAERKADEALDRIDKMRKVYAKILEIKHRQARITLAEQLGISLGASVLELDKARRRAAHTATTATTSAEALRPMVNALRGAEDAAAAAKCEWTLVLCDAAARSYFGRCRCMCLDPFVSSMVAELKQHRILIDASEAPRSRAAPSRQECLERRISRRTSM